ncbi:MAG: hypothetical protein KatS3mg131_1072 [Candidatus Tectimicrobiota bacterium]|nr:MAG: hypothetical protein KatS3mg131_1072 [Candidatus Tectomicrobia bacterium]
MHPDKRHYFLCVSNVRTGSTWVETSLAALPDVHADYEIKWRPAYPPRPLHLVIPDATWRCREQLRQLSATAPVVGSKLVLDPYAMLSRSEIEALLATIEPDIRIVFLTRDYFSIIKSLLVRGGINRLAQPTDPRLTGVLADTLRTTPPEAESTYQPLAVNQESFNAIVNTVLILFVNDLVCLEIYKRAYQAMHVDYENIQERFKEIARFVGTKCSDDIIEEVIINPTTKKLQNIDNRFVDNWHVLQLFCAYMDCLRDLSIRKRLSLFDFYRDDGQGHVTVTAPGIEETYRICQTLLARLAA